MPTAPAACRLAVVSVVVLCHDGGLGRPVLPHLGLQRRRRGAGDLHADPQLVAGVVGQAGDGGGRQDRLGPALGARQVERDDAARRPSAPWPGSRSWRSPAGR